LIGNLSRNQDDIAAGGTDFAKISHRGFGIATETQRTASHEVVVGQILSRSNERAPTRTSPLRPMMTPAELIRYTLPELASRPSMTDVGAPTATRLRVAPAPLLNRTVSLPAIENDDQSMIARAVFWLIVVVLPDAAIDALPAETFPDRSRLGQCGSQYQRQRHQAATG
jgi:hypothetical protein